MPANNSQTNHTFSRYGAPLAPVALALAMNFVPSNKTPAATQNGPVVINGVSIEAEECGEDITDFQACHQEYPTGCSKAGGYDPYLLQGPHHVYVREHSQFPRGLHPPDEFHVVHRIGAPGASG